MRILVADDDPTTVAFISRIVRRMEHEPLVARSGTEAWKCFTESHPRLVVTDWLMPGLTGVDLCRRIRANESEGQSTYVMMVTSLSSQENLMEGFAAGADDYLAKPSHATEVECRLGVGLRAVKERMVAFERSHRQIIEKCQDVLGNEHPDLLENLAALTHLCTEQRAFVRARAFVRRQIRIATKHGNAEELARLQALLADLRDREDAAFDHGTARVANS